MSFWTRALAEVWLSVTRMHQEIKSRQMPGRSCW